MDLMQMSFPNHNNFDEKALLTELNMSAAELKRILCDNEEHKNRDSDGDEAKTQQQHTKSVVSRYGRGFGRAIAHCINVTREREVKAQW